jgi:eukaryotic-like serine/threonine-protein kinase
VTMGAPSTVVRVSRTGAATPLDPSWPPSEMGPLVVSPDGKQAAVSVGVKGRADIWIKQLDRGALTRLTTDGGLNLSPSWRPDGSVGYVASDGGWHLEFRRSDGTGPVGRIDVGSTTYLANPVWSPDGKWVLYESVISGRSRIDARRIGTDSVVALAQSPAFDATGPALSPDGQWAAYSSNESGRFEVYVRPFPDVPRERHQVSRLGGQWPAWSADGRELYFVDNEGRLEATPVRHAPRFEAGKPTALFEARAVLLGGGVRAYAPERGRRSFLTLRPETTSAAPELVMVVNWFSELRAKAQLK